MTVAMSRARLGLYILGRREVFEACPELRPAFDILLSRPDKLMLVTGELWPTQRPALGVDDDGSALIENEVTMEGVEHLGQYVFEMTSTKSKQLEAENRMVDVVEPIAEEDGDGGENKGQDDEAQNSYYDGLVEPDIQEVREGEAN